VIKAFFNSENSTKKKEFLYNAYLKTYHDRILNKSVIDKLSVSFAGKVCHGFWHQTTGACFRHQKQALENGQCVINLTVKKTN